jgi:2-polyprenyl-3-methyl-5-hydroxy-6-metoxy-1,4-benzoquinol methylase
MAKLNEINYVAAMKTVLSVDDAEVRRGLLGKPWNEPTAVRYFFDFAQLLKLLPTPPARILDLGVGPGWTSIFLARCGYAVLGLDIAPDMIRLAEANAPDGLKLEFRCHDYERTPPETNFDVVLIYDALHHAEDEGAVIASAFHALKRDGFLITVEPGAGHSKDRATVRAVERFGTTEKDMEFARQLPLMYRAGFQDVHQYVRLSELVLEPVNAHLGIRQMLRFWRLGKRTRKEGLTSFVLAIK